MELKVKDDTFYVLVTGDEKRLYDSENAAVSALKTLVAEKESVNSDDVNIFEVNMAGEKWEIESIPWSKIAIGLIKGERK